MPLCSHFLSPCSTLTLAHSPPPLSHTHFLLSLSLSFPLLSLSLLSPPLFLHRQESPRLFAEKFDERRHPLTVSSNRCMCGDLGGRRAAANIALAHASLFILAAGSGSQGLCHPHPQRRTHLPVYVQALFIGTGPCVVCVWCVCVCVVCVWCVCVCVCVCALLPLCPSALLPFCPFPFFFPTLAKSNPSLSLLRFSFVS